MKTFFFWRALALVSLVLGLGLEHSCPWPRECLSSERLSLALASDFFGVLGLGLEPCVLDSTSGDTFECTRLLNTSPKLDIYHLHFLIISFRPLPLSKSWLSAIRLRLQIFHSTICLPHKNFLFRKFLMTSLHVICGLAPPNQKSWLHLCKDGSTVRSEFAYYVPRTLNRTVPAYRTSVQFLKRTVPSYRTCTITKTAYRTSVPYFLAKIEAYRTVLPSLFVQPTNFLKTQSCTRLLSLQEKQ